MRYSNAAYTSKHTVITLKSAMIRSGFLRESEEARKRGAENTNAAFRPGLALIAGLTAPEGVLGIVQFIGGENATTLLVDEGLMGSDGARESPFKPGDDLGRRHLDPVAPACHRAG